MNDIRVGIRARIPWDYRVLLIVSDEMRLLFSSSPSRDESNQLNTSLSVKDTPPKKICSESPTPCKES